MRSWTWWSKGASADADRGRAVRRVRQDQWWAVWGMAIRAVLLTHDDGHSTQQR